MTGLHPGGPAAYRTFGALQRMVALLRQDLLDDGSLDRARWLAAADGDDHARALRERAWAELRGSARVADPM